MNNLIQNIFSVKNEGCHKVFRLCGLKFAFKNKYKELLIKLAEMENKIFEFHENNKIELQNEIKNQEIKMDVLNSVIFDLFQNSIIEKRASQQFDIQKYLNKIKEPPEYLCVDSYQNYLNMFLKLPSFKFKKNTFNRDKAIISWEIARWGENICAIMHTIQQNKEILFVGDGFLRSINTIASANTIEKFRKGISFTFDDLTCYYDATRQSRLELMLNDKELIFSDEQIQRARVCIDKIISTHLTKYNHQPIFEPNIGREGAKKVLVVDQSFGDMSIAKGLANEETFKEMLDCAIRENPDADIIIKTHPDTIAGAGGYYKGYKPHDNVYTQTEPINPISLIKYVDKVYVCTTQLGFEALMCGKEVNVFGMPFYAGWGLTKDKQVCPRRTNKRTLEEVFYIAYIMYSHYVNPDKKCRCEIEEAMAYLLKLREEYFKEKSKFVINIGR